MDRNRTMKQREWTYTMIYTNWHTNQMETRWWHIKRLGNETDKNWCTNPMDNMMTTNERNGLWLWNKTDLEEEDEEQTYAQTEQILWWQHMNENELWNWGWQINKRIIINTELIKGQW